MNLNHSETIFNQCGELMSLRIGSSLAEMMNNVEETLFAMASYEREADKASEYHAAIRIVRMKKHEIQTRFKNRFISLFQSRIRNLVQNRRSYNQSGMNGHSRCLNNIDSDEGKMIKHTADKVKNDCHASLLNLDKRISDLLDDVEIAGDRYLNPMQPETVIEAFWESCRDIDIKPEIREVLVHLFEKYVVYELKYLYEDLDTHLSRQLPAPVTAQHQL